MKKLQLELHTFLKKHLHSENPVLIALSGGPDSLALFHLLVEYQQKHAITLAIAHVDHRWRAESQQEAAQLALLAKSYQMPFHLKTLDPNQLQGNLEEACRGERLKFFSELCNQYGYQAVILAHHANDQAETVLKRLLEGAALTSLSGLQRITVMDQLTLWRPLLRCAKADILEWLEEKGLIAFEDNTNYDPKYLRARFRTDIIPYLSQAFGKEIQNNLCHLAEETHELQSYFQDKLKQFPVETNADSSKILINLQQSGDLHPYELKMILRELLRRYGIVASRQQLQAITDLLLNNKSNKQIEIGKYCFMIDRRRLFIYHLMEMVPLTMQNLVTGTCGSWNITVNHTDQPKPNKIGWKHVWQGHVEISLPAANYLVGPPDFKKPYPNELTSIAKWWTNEKVPTFLRSTVPVIWEGDGNRIKHEFLSSRYMRQEHESENAKQWLHITLTGRTQRT